jgi:glutamyl-tRNA synthetase
LASWVVARRSGGKIVLRVEDIDRPRVVPGAEGRIEEDLLWLGLDWDEGPVRQSDRVVLYDDAIAALTRRGVTYPCDCSRAEIARLASAPHAGEEAVYPGTCSRLDPERVTKRPPAWRARVGDEVVAYDDGAVGLVRQDLGREVGDFVVKRGDGVFAYQLAVLVDDLEMGITHVVRGQDLVTSTPRQVWLARALGKAPPAYTHVPLVVDPFGARLQKRTPGATVRELREAGVGPERVIGELAHGLGLAPTNAPASAIEIARAVAGQPLGWTTAPWPIPERW